MPTVHYMLYDKATGELDDSHCTASGIELVEDHLNRDRHGYVLGHWAADQSYVDKDGKVRRHDGAEPLPLHPLPEPLAAVSAQPAAPNPAKETANG